MRVPLFIRLICVLFALVVAVLGIAAFLIGTKVTVVRSQQRAQAQAETTAMMELARARAKLASVQNDLARDLERATQSAKSAAGASASMTATSTSPNGDAVAEVDSAPAPAPPPPTFRPPQPELPAPPTQVGPSIPPSPEESLFKPDIYPTPRAAMAALVPQVIGAINDLPAGTLDGGLRMVIRDRDALETLQKTGRDRNAVSAEPCLRLLPDALRENFPQLDVRRSDDSGDASGSEPRLILNVATKDVRSTRVSWSARPCVSGTMLVSISLENVPAPAPAPAPAGARSNPAQGSAQGRVVTKLAAKFTDRHWADTPAEFPVGTWMVAATPNPVESPARAEAVALDLAANALTPTVAERAGIAAGTADQRVSAQIKGALKRGDACLADRFTQSFQRPYGTVYTERMLLDASPARIADLARRVSSAARAEAAVKHVQIDETRTTFQQVLGFMLVVVVLYWFLNAATKGYFTWQLRAGAVLLVLAGVVMIVATAGYFMVPHTIVVGH